MEGGLALLPLALISAVTEAELPGIIERMARRLSGSRKRKQAAIVWAAAFILSGLRYSPELSAQLFRGVVSMKESSTYQIILEEGRAEGRAEGVVLGAVGEAKKFLRIQGDRAFGPPDDRTAALIEQLDDLAQLEELFKRMQSTTSWQDLLGRPPTPRRGGRRSPS